MPLRCRLIEQNGTKAWLRVYWHDPEPCPGLGYYNAQLPLIETDVNDDWKLGGRVEDYPEERWPTQCAHCGATVPEGRLDRELPSKERVHRQIHRKRRWNTASGVPEPGDMFWADYFHGEDGGCFQWSNCVGPHLLVILPNGDQWDIDSRATNCTMKDKRTHCCWVRTGEPPNISVSKAGHTCAAGAGSISSGGYHGFLRNGILT